MTEPLHAVIAGGGIAGLTCAVTLCQQQWRVTLIEQAPEFSEVGAGLQLSPNGVRILEALQVMPFLEQSLFEPEAIEMRNGLTGKPVFRLAMRDTALKRWGARYLNVYRPDLVDALLQRLQTYVQNGQLQLQNGQRIDGYRQTPDELLVEFEKSSTLNADLLVAADGIQSSLRQQMHKKEDAQPRFTGNVAWRAVVPVDAFGDTPPPPTACIWTGDSKHAVTTRIRGGRWVNFVGVVEQDSWREEGWRIRGTHEEAHADFAGWNDTITQCINAADELYRWALYDREPLPGWSDGRVVLVGDAAHPMLPSMAQGAVQSIEDAYSLSIILDTFLKDASKDSKKSASTNAYTDTTAKAIEAACAEFYNQRIKRTSRVQKLSASNMKLFHTRGHLQQMAKFEPARVAGKFAPWVLYRMNDWLYGDGSRK